MSGGAIAAPTFSRITSQTLNYLHITPDKQPQYNYENWQEAGQLLQKHLGALLMPSGLVPPTLKQCQDSDKRVLLRMDAMPLAVADNAWKNTVLYQA